MDGTARLSIVKGGGSKINIRDKTAGLDPEKLDFLIDMAIMEWVESHPGKMAEYTQMPEPDVSAGGE